MPTPSGRFAKAADDTIKGAPMLDILKPYRKQQKVILSDASAALVANMEDNPQRPAHETSAADHRDAASNMERNWQRRG
jgi:hypothetical protein